MPRVNRIGLDTPAAEYWDEKKSSSYAAEIDNSYHRQRLAMIRSLIRPFNGRGKTVLDYGCGNGVLMSDFPDSTVLGIEPSDHLFKAAKLACPTARIEQGTFDKLAEVETYSVDLLLCINVAHYFTDAEDDLFYREAYRVLKDDGILIISHSNELFDMFTLNAYSVDFFKRNFGVDPSPLLSKPHLPSEIHVPHIRENPLSFPDKLAKYRLTEERQGYNTFHRAPPLLDAEPRMEADDITIAWPRDERWKLMFQCSTFGSRARKI